MGLFGGSKTNDLLHTLDDYLIEGEVIEKAVCRLLDF